MGLFAFFGLTIFLLCFAVVFERSFTATYITTICLPSPTASANAKLEPAPSTLNTKQQQWKGHLRLGKQPEGAKGKGYDWELPDDCGSSCEKPETDDSGLQSWHYWNIADRCCGDKRKAPESIGIKHDKTISNQTEIESEEWKGFFNPCGMKSNQMKKRINNIIKSET